MWLGTSFSLVLVSAVPGDCTTSTCLPHSLYSPRPPQWLPSPRSLLVPGCPLCSGRGGNWCSNIPPCILQQVLGPATALVLCRSQGPYRLSVISSLSVFQCPLQFLASKLHISWDSIGCSLCSSEDRLGVLGTGRTGLLSHLLAAIFSIQCCAMAAWEMKFHLDSAICNLGSLHQVHLHPGWTQKCCFECHLLSNTALFLGSLLFHWSMCLLLCCAMLFWLLWPYSIVWY